MVQVFGKKMSHKGEEWSLGVSLTVALDTLPQTTK